MQFNGTKFLRGVYAVFMTVTLGITAVIWAVCWLAAEVALSGLWVVGRLLVGIREVNEFYFGWKFPHQTQASDAIMCINGLQRIWHDGFDTAEEHLRLEIWENEKKQAAKEGRSPSIEMWRGAQIGTLPEDLSFVPATAIPTPGVSTDRPGDKWGNLDRAVKAGQEIVEQHARRSRQVPPVMGDEEYVVEAARRG